MARLLPSDVFRIGDALDPLEKLVTLALIDYGPRAFPAQQTLAVKCGLSRRCVQNVLERLRQKGVVTTSSTGKALTYVINLGPEVRTTCAPCCAPRAQEMRTTCASDAHHVRRDPKERNGTREPNQAPAPPAAGWGGVPESLQEAIRRRDPGADLVASAQRAVVSQILASVGITADRDHADAWRLLCQAWAATGHRPYDIARKSAERLDGAKDVRAVVLHRIRGAA
jgi:biotin operon repressor